MKRDRNNSYDVLGVIEGQSKAEMKKAVRRLTLFTHPDKSSYALAEEAFKGKSSIIDNSSKG